MTPVIKADGFIWLIVGIFWVVAQIAGAASKKNAPRRTARSGDDNKTSPADPFAELLRKLNAAQQFEIPQPEYEELPEEEPEPNPVFVAQNAWRHGDIEKLPEIEPIRRQAPSHEPAAISPIEAEFRPSMSAFRNTLPAMKLPSMPLGLPLPAVTALQPRGISRSARVQPMEKSGENFPNIGNIIDPADRTALRRAMLGHILFSPPKALE